LDSEREHVGHIQQALCKEFKGRPLSCGISHPCGYIKIWAYYVSYLILPEILLFCCRSNPHAHCIYSSGSRNMDVFYTRRLWL